MNGDEEWRQIEGYPDYFVSDMGNVYSERSHKVLTPVLQRDGYVRIALRNENGPRLFHIQRLVVEAFIGEIDEGLEVNHINHNRSDNRLSNLEIVSRSENMRDTTSNHNYQFAFVESLPEDARPFEHYGNHEFEDYFISGNQLFLFIREGRYRVLDVRYDAHGYPYYNVMDINRTRTHVQVNRLE